MLTVFIMGLCAQNAGADPQNATTPAERRGAFRQRQKMHKKGLFHDLSFRCVGPVVMSGRVVDIQPHKNGQGDTIEAGPGPGSLVTVGTS